MDDFYLLYTIIKCVTMLLSLLPPLIDVVKKIHLALSSSNINTGNDSEEVESLEEENELVE